MLYKVVLTLDSGVNLGGKWLWWMRMKPFKWNLWSSISLCFFPEGGGKHKLEKWVELYLISENWPNLLSVRPFYKWNYGDNGLSVQSAIMFIQNKFQFWIRYLTFPVFHFWNQWFILNWNTNGNCTMLIFNLLLLFSYLEMLLLIVFGNWNQSQDLD